jgi:hypothetical protein
MIYSVKSSGNYADENPEECQIKLIFNPNQQKTACWNE